MSHQTVSRVLNGHPHVREGTRHKVLSAIGELGYRPNRAARALVTGRSQVLGVVAPRTTLFGPVSLLAAFEEQAAEAGFTVIVARLRTFDQASTGNAVRRLLDQRVAGMAVIAPVASAIDALRELPSGVPIVTVDSGPDRLRPAVNVDQAEGARLATQHLLDAGHATVWHVSGPSDWFDAAERMAGWSDTLRRAGLEPPPVVPADWTSAAGYRAGQLLGRMPEVTAVFAANDSLALGLLRALHELGRSVPDQVSVVGFDDIPEAEFLVPPLTTVRQDFESVARQGLDLLLAQLELRDGQESRIIAPVLVERASVAPPAAQG
ncbi:LacI family DNA-binding transcriptional regulator [Pseudonocardia humida]|uniref:LacI family DNA-binding transcriptional regulator n=1 Tax=Pseudonocardia humida TaxID=2800819 RepID=UPI00207D70CC|nr:substrate-binding domain-containing protein [Pseudonocardia humida]